jgi:hypothetical protein
MYHNALEKKEDLLARCAAKVAELEAEGLTEAGAAAAWARVAERRKAAAGLPALETVALAQAAAHAAAGAAAALLEATQHAAAAAKAAAAQLLQINAACCGLCEAMAGSIATVAVEAGRAASQAAAVCAARNEDSAAARARVEAALAALEEMAKRDAPAHAAILLMHRASILDPEAIPAGLLQRSHGAASGENAVLAPNTSNSVAEVSTIDFGLFSTCHIAVPKYLFFAYAHIRTPSF